MLKEQLQDITCYVEYCLNYMKKIIEIYKLWAELNKLRITVIVTLTTLAGYTLVAEKIDSAVVLPLIGIFILACGSAAMNQYQERDKDLLMDRTKNRPIPTGKIKAWQALLISLVEITGGIWLLYAGSGFEAAFLGFMAFVWYNIIYTPMKRISAFAVIPGSVIGSIPPMVGWVAGGGSIADPQLYIMAFFFFISQVPHFWLLTLKYGDEYHKAGFPIITKVFIPTQTIRVTFVWIVATSLNVLLMVVAGLFHTLAFQIILIVSSVWLIVAFSKLVQKSVPDFNPVVYFMRLNIVLLIVILSMIFDPLI